MSPDELKSRLYYALEISQILKRQSREDWRNVVDMVSREEGNPIKVFFIKNKEETSINYVVSASEPEIAYPSPLETGIEYLAANQGFESTDHLWGVEMAKKIQLGYPMTPDEATDAYERLAKYEEQLQEVYLSLPFFEEIAHHYDSTLKPVKVIRGEELGSPFGEVNQLQAALKQKPQPSQLSENLAKTGQICLNIGHSFQNGSSELNGLNLISSTANVMGAAFLVMGAAAEGLRQKAANQFNPDKALGDVYQDLQALANDFDNLDADAQIILKARGEDISYKPIKLIGGERDDLSNFAQNLLERQSILIQALDSDRMPSPVSVDGSNASLSEAIAKIKANDQDLKQLVSDIHQKEQPLKTLDGAIQAQHLHERLEQFFQGREEANQRLFNPELEYQLTTQQELTLTWNAQKFTVSDRIGTSLCHIQRTTDGYQVMGEPPSPELVTIFTHFPNSASEIRRFSAEGVLSERLQEITPDYADKQLKLQAINPKTNNPQEVCTFNFLGLAEVTGKNAQGDLVWYSVGEKVVIDDFPLNILEKISRHLSRPLGTQQSDFTIEKQPTLSV